MNTYPDAFYVAHKLFTGTSFAAGGEWGDVLDGPVSDEHEVIEKIAEAFKDDPPPTSETMRVFWVDCYDRSADCTEWVCAAVAELRGAE